MIICGLDLSLSVCGYSIAENGIIIDAGFFSIDKVNTYKDKANIIIKGLENKKFDIIHVEETLAGFAFGGTSQQVILKLAMNKAVICYILEEHYNIKVNSYNVNTMRKRIFGKSRIKGIPPKEFVKMRLEMLMPDIIKFYSPSKELTRGKNKGKFQDNPKNADLRDAIICSLYFPK
jgi:Holliday junction resolvasome RuvABC endonuclease subunit